MQNTALGTHDIARICHVTPPAIIRWIEDGKIPSFTTGGGHRRVWGRDLVVFMREHNMSIPPELADKSKLRILVVEDDSGNRKFLLKVLRKYCPEAELGEAEDGFEAGHKINAFRPSLVILDLQLPGINGVKVCRMVRGDPHLRAVKILAMTGYNMEDARREVLGAGADDFLGKPFEILELTGKIERLLPAGRKRRKTIP